MIDDVAFCITTFERPGVAQRCVDSILKLWPDAKIYQADNSQQPAALKGVAEFFPLPYDCGISAARNHLVRHTTEDFIICIDDDYIFTHNTKLDDLHQVLVDHDSIVLAGCKCRHIRPKKTGWTKYFADVTLVGGVLTASRPSREMDQAKYGWKWYLADTVSNFWMAKRRLFDCMMWDERLKIGGEHADFFQRIQASNGDVAMMDRIKQKRASGPTWPLEPVLNEGNMQVAFLPHVWIDHKKNRPTKYQKMRRRDRNFEQVYRDMWSIKKVNRWRYGKA